MKNSKILRQDFVTSSQLNVNKLEVQIDKIEDSSNDIDISLLISKNSNGEAFSRFYWWDAYEDTYKQQGIVYLFGKIYIDSIKTCYSCCLSIQNLPRRIYLLPTKYVCKMIKFYYNSIIKYNIFSFIYYSLQIQD